MRITLLNSRSGDTIAREDASDGEFFLKDAGDVWYHNALDPTEWFVNHDERAFAEIAIALNKYAEEVQGANDELAVVERLRADLTRLGCLSGRGKPFWSLILEQAEDGML